MQDDILKQAYPEVGFGSLVQVLGMDRVTIGAGSLVSDGAWINVCSPATGGSVTIGKCVQVGRYSMLNSGGVLELGDYCLLGPHVVISNADHVTDDVNLPYVAQGARLGGETLIGDNCWLAANVCVVGSATVGRGSIVGAGSVVTRDVEPFCMVAGNPGRVVRMYNPESGAWEGAASKEEKERIRRARERKPLPGPEEYRRLLDNGGVRGLDAVFAGNGVCL
ncbi:putative acetyltransferase [Pseudodesulfovibrio hydrargyri]|uniref:Putative acetyltransferase n=1 Tax=Pseudodesulfovibrio hydrargyri TaxID=2125990 RepID=A0A1J5N9W8_9BACT|nr:acyltransferase [Pseudodesulfovibrio hydrargyri]OIQ50047.1 putative acetyltransferase [Pseudodesulfovibrio hydrargyri]